MMKKVVNQTNFLKYKSHSTALYFVYSAFGGAAYGYEIGKMVQTKI